MKWQDSPDWAEFIHLLSLAIGALDASMAAAERISSAHWIARKTAGKTYKPGHGPLTLSEQIYTIRTMLSSHLGTASDLDRSCSLWQTCADALEEQIEIDAE